MRRKGERQVLRVDLRYVAIGRWFGRMATCLVAAWVFTISPAKAEDSTTTIIGELLEQMLVEAERGQDWDAKIRSIYEDRDRVVENIADLIDDNRTRFVVEFSKGRFIELAYVNQMFKDGRIVFGHTQEVSSIFSSTEYIVTCILELEDAKELREGELHVFDAKLNKLEDEWAEFICSTSSETRRLEHVMKLTRIDAELRRREEIAKRRKAEEAKRQAEEARRQEEEARRQAEE